MAQSGDDVEGCQSVEAGQSDSASAPARVSFDVASPLPGRPASGKTDFYTPQTSQSRPETLSASLGVPPVSEIAKRVEPARDRLRRTSQLARDSARRALREARRRAPISLTWTAYAAIAFVAGVLLILYGVVPEWMIQRRLEAAPVDIREAILEIGGNNGAFVIQPTLDFTVPREVLQLPLVSYSASVNGFTGRIYFHRTEADHSVSKLLLGEFDCKNKLYFNTEEDVHIRAGGLMSVDRPENVQVMMREFVARPNITLSLEAVVNIWGRVYGFLPMALFGVTISKALTIDAFNGFRGNPIRLTKLLGVEANPEQAAVTATANIFNPTVCTLIMKEDFEMNIAFPDGERDVNPIVLAIMKVAAPMRVSPGNNSNRATVVLRPTKENEDTVKRFVAAYMGEQEGIMLAGERALPLPVRIWDVRSGSKLVETVTKDLVVDVDFAVLPMKFLSAVTADIVALNDLRGYSVFVNLLITNPLPQLVKVRAVELHAHHPDLNGDVIYDYNRVVEPPYLNPLHYRLEANQTKTVSFELSPAMEVKAKVVSNMLNLVRQATQGMVSLGIDLVLTVEVGRGDGLVMPIAYQNHKLEGKFCVNALPPRSPCGGLPKNDESIHPRVINNYLEDPLFWS
mmetsp:Transcript_91029/g.262410  ORF Transcript_91029/g.262410 Transcript_91029/m.262410 type:complete len:627 (-) Transcript_91029:252-2132(-)